MRINVGGLALTVVAWVLASAWISWMFGPAAPRGW